MRAIQLGAGQLGVSIEGTEYKANKDGIVTVSPSHFDTLTKDHGFKTPEQVEAAEKAEKQAREALAKIEAEQARIERERRLEEAKALLEASGLKVSSK